MVQAGVVSQLGVAEQDSTTAAVHLQGATTPPVLLTQQPWRHWTTNSAKQTGGKHTYACPY